MKQDQQTYIEGLKSGNQKVFSELFHAYYEPLCRYCIRVIPDQDEAEEIVQEVFVNLWSKRNSINIGTSLNAYLYRAVMNRSINFKNHVKTRKTHQDWVLSLEKDLVIQQDNLIENELQLIYETTVANMPNKRRIVFELSRKEGLKYAEIAERMSLSVKTVEAHLSKALEDLRIHLSDYLPSISILLWLIFLSN
jgi:RNA polymerase sigma-70 factor, ECF subfamily